MAFPPLDGTLSGLLLQYVLVLLMALAVVVALLAGAKALLLRALVT